MTPNTRLELILEYGEVMSGLYSAGRSVVANIFPKQVHLVTNTCNLLPYLQSCVPEATERLRSAARGGAKLALGLVWAITLKSTCGG